MLEVFYAEEIRAVHVVDDERRSVVRRFVSNLDIREFQILRVPNEKAVCGKFWTEHVRIRIFVFVFRRLEGRHFVGAPALVLKIQVADLDVLDGVPWDAANNRR